MAVNFSTAISDFRNARSQADLKLILSRLTGEPTQLLSYDEVVQKLRMQGSAERGLKDIPLDAIVGSVGRYTDFTRDFLPRSEVSGERWARVKIAVDSATGLPPIDVYQIGDAYFVKDGNHRVSVARQLGASHIQAYVTEVRTRVPLTPDTRPDELIIMAEYADFLEKTRLDELRPGADLRVTVPGQYEQLLEHIAVHKYFMGLDFQRDIPYDEAVTHFYDTVYLPVVQLIRERGILQYFPGRTETDLYLWLAEHRAQLQQQLGWRVEPAAAAEDLVSQQKPGAARLVSQIGSKLLDATRLDTVLEAGPPPGEWRKERQAYHRDDRMFMEILVTVSGQESGWPAVDQAIAVAQREGGMLLGLHVIADEEGNDSAAVQAIRSEFNLRCAQSGVAGELAVASGEISRQICNRARYADLIVARLNYPPASQTLARLGSGFRALIQRCPRPILAVPAHATALSRALLAYDGSPKATEALYIATYIAGQWNTGLTVLRVDDNSKSTPAVLDTARRYLEEHGLVEVEYVQEAGPVAETILRVSRERDCDLLIMGGYGNSPVLEAVLGSSVDQVLRESHKPILICR